MTICAAAHPDLPGLSCILNRTERGHPEHVAMRYTEGRSQPEQERWPNPDYRAPADLKAQGRQVRAAIEVQAAAVRSQLPSGRPKPVLKKTRLGQVANLLVNNVGVWIDGHRLETQQIGGSSGLRRLRELRDDYGWNIIQRPTEGSTDQYMLVEMPGDLRGDS
jgi:hypothetical protein